MVCGNFYQLSSFVGVKTTDRDCSFYTTFSVFGIDLYVRELLPLKPLIKEVIDNLGTDSEKLKFVSISTFYEDSNGAIVVATSPIMTTTSKHITIKYHCFMQHIGKEFVI